MGKIMERKITVEDVIEVMNESVECFSDKVSQIIDIFVDAISNHVSSSLWDSFKNEGMRMEALANYLGIFEDQEKMRVYYFAAIKTIIDLDCRISAKWNEQSLVEEYKKYKYLYPILKLLNDYPMLTQGKIAQELGISKNALANTIKRTEHFQLWTVSRRGRNQFYMITEKGKRAFTEYHKMEIKTSDGQFSNVLLTFLKALDIELCADKPDTEKIIWAIDRKYGQGSNIMDSCHGKQQLQEFLYKHNHIQRRRQQEQRLEEWCKNDSMKKIRYFRERKNDWDETGYGNLCEPEEMEYEGAML